MNFARLNHILIPDTKEGRDRLRQSLLGRLFGKLGDLWYSMTREGRVVLFVAILAGLFGLEVRTRQAYLLWAALFGLLVASYLIRSAFRLDGVEVVVEAPRLVSVGEDVAMKVRLINGADREHQLIQIDGPLLPWDGQYVSERETIRRIPARGQAEATLRARFTARGEHHLDPVMAGAVVPFGLVAAPLVTSRGIRFLVVPRVAPVERLRTPLLHRYQPGGVALASQTGESLELMGVRPYRPGDPVRDLHARRWARLGVPVVKEYRQEYFTRIGVVVDTDLGLSDEERLEAALSLAAGVVAHLSRGEALIDLLVVGLELHQLTLGRSLGFLDQALELLAVVKPGPGFDADLLARRLEPHLEQLSCVVLISLGWNDERQALVDRVLGGGVGCRVLEVTASQDEDLGVTGGADVSRLSVASLSSTKGLSL